MKHIGTRCFVHTMKGLEVLPDVNEGLLGVCSPLGLVLLVQVIVMIPFPCPLEVKLKGFSLVIVLIIGHISQQTWWNMIKHAEARACCVECSMLIPGSLVPSWYSLPREHRVLLRMSMSLGLRSDNFLVVL